MKVAIVHYHLGPGGVSQVISTASRVLTEAGIQHVILVGEAPEDSVACLPLRLVPGLGYLTNPGNLTVASLTMSLRSAAREALGDSPDIWHFHNHSLGKNLLLADVVAGLAEENERLVLQIHDLAEDGRAENYQCIAGRDRIYPLSDRVSYVFLNARDMGIFTAAGLPERNACVLVNPLVMPETGLRDEFRAPIVFAPVRGIRRKNLGELVLLSALAPQGARFAVSRAPLNPAALPVHDHWQKFASRQQLPIAFDVVDHYAPAAGAAADFQSWMEHATHFVSSSVAEGFGLPFLEAAAHAKPLIGRNLSHISEEHARHGIRAGNLYDQLRVPADWIDLVILREQLTMTLERNHRAYCRPLSNDMINATFEALIHDGWLDFGNLTESLQQGVIERLADPACRRVPQVRISGEPQIAQDWLASAIANRNPSACPAQLGAYSPAAYGLAVAGIYTTLLARPASAVTSLPAGKILTAHLTPQSFHFLLSARKPDSPPFKNHRAVIFDIYGTLLIAPAGGVKPDPDADEMLRKIVRDHGYHAPPSPSSALHQAVLRHHATAGIPYPEVDLRVLWREVLRLDPDTDLGPLVAEIEAAWHPTRPMPGAGKFIQQLARAGVSLGLLSNAQCNTLGSLGGLADLFAPELTILSYQHGMAKPSPGLFEILTDRLAGRGISPGETLFIGNDPQLDVAAAAAHGFKTALFAGHPDSLRDGECSPDFVLRKWSDLRSSKMHGE